MFDVIKVRKKEIPAQINTNEYVDNNKIPDTSEFAVRNKIKATREKLGLTQSHVAEMLRITRQSFASIENEQQNPSLLMGWLIAKVLNANMEELFYIEELEDDYNVKRK